MDYILYELVQIYVRGSFDLGIASPCVGRVVKCGVPVAEYRGCPTYRNSCRRTRSLT